MDKKPSRSTREPADISEELHSLSKSLRVLKGHLTRTIRRLDDTVDFARAQGPSDPISRAIERRADDVEARARAVEEAYLNLEKVDPTNAESYNDDAEREARRADESITASWQALSELRAALNTQPVQVDQASDQANDQSTTHPQSNSRQASVLRPFTLRREHKPVELSKWIKLLTVYFDASAFNQSSIQVLQQYALACLDLYLTCQIERDITTTMPIFGDANSVIALIHAFFNKRYPIFTRRLEYYRTKQDQGQTASAWAKELLALGDEAELDDMTVDETHAMRVLASVSEGELLDKLLELKNPTLEDILAKIDDYESMVYKKEALDKNKVKSTTSSSVFTTASKTCGNCGRICHSKATCAATNAKCNNCGKTGHFASVCRHGRQKDRPPHGSKAQPTRPRLKKIDDSPRPHNTISTATVGKLFNIDVTKSRPLLAPTPHINVVIKNKNAPVIHVDALPD